VRLDDALRDSRGVEFDGLLLAYWHAIGMARRVRHEFPDAGNDWVIEIEDEAGRKPLVVLPPNAPYSATGLERNAIVTASI
jgi:hypothetical protein